MAESFNRQSKHLSPLKCALCVAIFPFALQYIYIVNTFYCFGAEYFDEGLFANLLWRNDWLLTTPHVHGGDHSYLTVHFSPFLMLINELSYIVPTHMAEFYAAFMACIYASLGAAMCYILMVCAAPKTMWQVFGLGLLATGFAFNGFIEQGVWMSHFEYAIPAGILMFLFHLKRGNMTIAILFFALTLLMREDAGLHIAAVLTVLIAAQLIRTRSFAGIKPEMVFALAACVYSVCAFVIGGYMRSVDGVTDSVFKMIYSGTPSYAHLSIQLLCERAFKILTDAPYLFTGFLVSLAWAVRRRNIYWILGFAAYIPWFLVNWTANNPNTGVLYSYYVFPFVLSMGWPCIAILYRYGKAPPSAAVYDALVMQTALVFVGLVVWNTDQNRIDFGPTWWARWGSYAIQWDTTPGGREIDTRPIVRDITREISTNPGLGTVMLDSGMMSLTMGSNPQQRGLQLLPLYDSEIPNTLVYFCPVDSSPPKEIADKAKQNALSAHYSALDAPICLFTNRSIEQMGRLGTMLTIKPLVAAQ
jgi:hypothetical protein